MYVTKAKASVHTRWLNRIVHPGDEVLVRIVDSPRSDRPKSKTVNTAALIRKQQRAYYFQMKKTFEPARGPWARRRAGKGKDAA